MKVSYNPEIKLQHDYETEEVYSIEDSDDPNAASTHETLIYLIQEKEKEQNTQYGEVEMPPHPHNVVYYKRNSHSGCSGMKLDVFNIFVNKELSRRILHCICLHCTSNLILCERKKEKPSAVTDKGT